MGFEFRQGGRRMSQKQFFAGTEKRMFDAGLAAIEEKYHGIAAAIVDPATGKHAEVFIRRTDKHSLAISTSGSPAYARELERRLGLREGDCENDGANARINASGLSGSCFGRP